MVYRLYVEKKPGFDHEAHALLSDARSFLMIKNLENIRIFNRYDVENISESNYSAAVPTIFSEPQVDNVYRQLPDADCRIFAAEYLPGQFDQRADSAAQCVQLAFQCERPLVRTAQVYYLYGQLTDLDVESIKHHVINPVERREASLEKVATLKQTYELPESVETIKGFISLDENALESFRKERGLAMDFADILFCQSYFQGEGRDPSITEIRMIDTYWSDHCRHTTFLTELTGVRFEDPQVAEAYEHYLSMRQELGIKKPITLMNLATIAVKYFRSKGLLDDMDISDEINACTVKFDAVFDGKPEKWLLLFKNETHNHPTEIEPFGGAATCLGGAIRDPLSGRAFVYQAMRVTGAADPTKPVSETIKGKLPQRELTVTAANGYSSYGNQIGLATGLVDELYHPGYAAKRLEIGAVIGAAPAENVRRECPAPGDVIVLLGGRTGRDGCGGATGSSKSHTLESIHQCGAEVQKGNAPEERKLQRLFRNPTASRLIKRCNDFGAGGVSVAIGELADGLDIDLNAVPRKYDGLDGTELAISESQERMAVALAPEDVSEFIDLAHAENLEATIVAKVTGDRRLRMRWNNRNIVDISRDFLNSNGAERSTEVLVKAPKPMEDRVYSGDFKSQAFALASDLNFCSKRGLAERFDSTNGASSLLMPFGGKRQLTPAQAMASLIPSPGRESETCSVMSYGFDPYLCERDPFTGAYVSVVDSIARLAATGAPWRGTRLTFQEYFERMTCEESWGKPLSALLGALTAQLDYETPSIGGKDSMSGSFEDMSVPPTLVSFAVNTCPAKRIISNEFKKSGSRLCLVAPDYNSKGQPESASQIKAFDMVERLIASGVAISAQVIAADGIAGAAMKMSFGNAIGCKLFGKFNPFAPMHGAFLLEISGDAKLPEESIVGVTSSEYSISFNDEEVDLVDLEKTWASRLEKVFPTNVDNSYSTPESYSYSVKERKTPAVKVAKPRVLIPVFPGTNCEYDAERAFLTAGAATEIMVIRNLSASDVADSASAFAAALANTQIMFIPGGFSGGDEPDGSGKFITSFLRNPAIADALADLIGNRDGLIGGICNGFQALIKLGLVPYGEIREAGDPDAPTLTFNHIARHQSRLVYTRIASNKSPWLMYADVGQVFAAPISHGEGRFVASDALLKQLADNGQIATQYADMNGSPTMDIMFNPNGSCGAVEGITSPDGRVFGRMAHAERTGKQLYKNVPGDYDCGMFRGAVDYFK